MNDDGEPQTVIYEEQLVTTWREQSGRWRVHVESKDMKQLGAIAKEKLLPDGRERLDAYELATGWIDRAVGNSL